MLLPLVVGLSACGGGGGGGGTKPTNSHGIHEPAPTPTLRSFDNAGVVVGVADTGFRITHESLASSHLATFNLVDGSGDVSGDEGHGTAVASLIEQGGASPALYLAKVSSDSSQGRAATNVLDYSVGYLADEGARVINHSWSGRANAPSASSSYLGVDSLDSLRRIATSNGGLGSVYVVAAGNDGVALQADRPIHRYDDIYSRMLIVGGSVRDDGDTKLASRSNRPGEDLDWQARFLTAPWQRAAADASGDDTYGAWAGTSIAAPQVAGYAAAMITLWPHLDAATISQRLLDTADRSSSLYQDESCGEGGDLNCGYYYLGQGEADLDAALAPAGSLSLATGDHLDEGVQALDHSLVQLSGAYGDSLASSGALADVAAFDELGRDYRIDLTDHAFQRDSHEASQRSRMTRLSSASPDRRQEQQGSAGALSWSTQKNGHGETLASRLDGRFGGNAWTLTRFAGHELDPASAYAESGIMPLLAFQGGSDLTRGLDTVHGLRNVYALNDRVTLQARHWMGDGTEWGAALGEEYQASRSDVGLRFDVSPQLGVSTTVGVLDERHGLLGGQGSGMLTLGERNRTGFASLGLDARLGRYWQAFAHYDRGRGDAEGRGFIQHIDIDQVEEMSVGLQRNRGRHTTAFAYRQPMRIGRAEAMLSVPVGRAIDGEVIREGRSVSLSPSGRQQEFELGYRYRTQRRGAIGFNLNHTREPGHDRNARSDTTLLLNYEVAF
ncbi:S8 family serine peptidase [Billgrantia diversa]|uniref:S8 family serine peptidase n=1 Tax=Halomonas sp. MCCC 1A13316 TaxID=2733487 RepID=UPI0018A44C3F|nr:S8 family serine peptidase [Halomonas sp. MCCC 1A13316]QOR40578.1 S8 family serine peptidase [Halomonas sp. MCCC 1A13316]